MARYLHRVADIHSSRRLKSSLADAVVVLATRLPTFGDRTFAVAASRVFNGQPAMSRQLRRLLLFRRPRILVFSRFVSLLLIVLSFS